jgi:trypsin
MVDGARMSPAVITRRYAFGPRRPRSLRLEQQLKISIVSLAFHDVAAVCSFSLRQARPVRKGSDREDPLQPSSARPGTTTRQLRRPTMPNQPSTAGEGVSREDEVLRQKPGQLPQVILPKKSDGQPIIGGEETHEFPDCCAVGSSGRYFCSGTLIAPTLVVTAGHCTSVTRVFLKGWNIQYPQDGETIKVSKQFSHDLYDISVLVLKNASTVTPRHVARGPEIGTPTHGLLVGFGTIDPDGRIGYGWKRMVEVKISSLGCATDKEVTKFGCRKGKEAVAGHRGLLKDSCRGDSGGPLYINNAHGNYDLLGAASRGIGGTGKCGDGGIYVRVDQMLDWIAQQTHITL